MNSGREGCNNSSDCLRSSVHWPSIVCLSLNREADDIEQPPLRDSELATKMTKKMQRLTISSFLLSSFDRRRHHHPLLPTSFIFVLSLAVRWTVRFAGASCNAVQSTSCLQAASGGSLDHLPGAGNCIAKPYFRYTHLCTVTNYMPSTDYCCCTFDAKLLCCRYHQGWYHFRCMETDDELEISVPSVSYTTSPVDLPLLTLVPVILCPLVAVSICIICITKCWCYRHDNDSSSLSSSSSSSSPDFCCRCYKIVEDKKEKLPRERFADDDDVTSPLQHRPPSPSAPPEVQLGSTSCRRAAAAVAALHTCDLSSHHPDVLLAPFYQRCDGPVGPFGPGPHPADPRYSLRGQPPPPPPRGPLLCHHHHHHHHPHGSPVSKDFPGVVHPQCHPDHSHCPGFCLRSLQCACAPPTPLSSAEARRHCDVIRSSVTRPANEQTTEACAADCLPPAYESIEAESSAQL